MIATIILIILVIGFILIVFYLLWLCFKIILTLIKAYVMVILLVMFAPIIILFGALTPRGGFGMWARSLASNLAVFPVVGFLFILSFWFNLLAFFSLVNQLPFLGAILGGIAPLTGQTWTPPLLPFGDAILGIVFSLASFVVFASIPKSADLIKSTLQGQPFSFGAAVGEAIGPVTYLPRVGYESALKGAQSYGAGRVEAGLGTIKSTLTSKARGRSAPELPQQAQGNLVGGPVSDE